MLVMCIFHLPKLVYFIGKTPPTPPFSGAMVGGEKGKSVMKVKEKNEWIVHIWIDYDSQLKNPMGERLYLILGPCLKSLEKTWA